MSQLQIQTPDGRTAFHPGEQVTLKLSWSFEVPPEWVELRLVWNTAGKGTTDLAVAQTRQIDDPQASETRRVSITLPVTPFSFSGQLISLIWALELIAFPSESSTRQEITIAPAGREVVLRGIEAESGGQWGEHV